MQYFWRQDGLAHFLSIGAVNIAVREKAGGWEWVAYEKNVPILRGRSTTVDAAKHWSAHSVAETKGLTLALKSDAFL